MKKEKRKELGIKVLKNAGWSYTEIGGMINSRTGVSQGNEHISSNNLKISTWQQFLKWLKSIFK